MRKIVFSVVAALALIGCAKEKKQEVTTEVEVLEVKPVEDWITLFDGSNFDQWKGYLHDGMHPEWSIDGNAMKFTPGEKGGKNIITKEKFKSFVLSLEWKISEAGNSGIFWGVFEDEKYPEAYQTGPEIQVLDNELHPDAKANPKFHQAGALYDMVQPEHDVCNPAGEWNKVVLTVDHTNNKGSVVLNDTEIVKFPVHGEGWDALVANSKFKDWEGFGKYPEGHIGLQDHSDIVWYRDIKIKRLD
ncbi:DUF1080 domain-containing protein [Urechidicola sp. KH5]